MGQKTLTIYDVPDHVRQKGAATAKANTLQLLSNPHISPEYRAELLTRLSWASKWENLKVGEVLPPPPPGRTPVNHEISLVEQLEADESVK
jgi:hypothetical protein